MSDPERLAFERWLNNGHHCGANENMWKSWIARSLLDSVMLAERVEQISGMLEGYAESYEMMARMEPNNRVRCSDVAFDIRNNMVKWVRKLDNLTKDALEAAPTQGADARPVSIPEPDTTHCAQWAGDAIKYHSVDQLVEYANACVRHALATHGDAPSDEHAKLLRFYSVDTPDALIVAMERHIEKLQRKLPKDNQPAFSRHREG